MPVGMYDDLDEQNEEQEPTGEALKFYKLLEDSKQSLYPGCQTFSKLSFIITLLHIKCLNGWSNKSFTMLLKLLIKAFPLPNSFPASYRKAKSVVQDLGLDYQKIDACPNDCMLFRGIHENAENCTTCGASRWKHGDTEKKRKVAMKTLRYFPLIPRLQRLFMCSKTAKQMTWHQWGRVNDGLMRHPADSEAWKELDRCHPQFAFDHRNVRLGLATDGFNPFGILSSTYSIWPVMLVVYNLPPWMCLKKPYTFLCLLIPGQKAPGNDIDVYLQPLLDELKFLWSSGVNTYDSSSKTNFKLHAALLWTVNDFPAYANLSGWTTKGALACPYCNLDTCSFRLQNGKKQCYLGHRRWLPENHEWRFDTEHFIGDPKIKPPTPELRQAPKPLTGEEVLSQLSNMEPVVFGKTQSSHASYLNWRKHSNLFELPNWKDNAVRQNLDVMHIVKGVCESLVHTLLGMEKSKDNINSRRDLEWLETRKELWLKEINGKLIMPVACYNLSSEEKQKFCQFIKDVKVPDGFSSNISRCAQPQEKKMINMKSHDYHVLMMHLLPLALRGLLPSNVLEPIIELSNFFRRLCSKVLNVGDLELLEKQIAVTMCKLERIFPPSFFDSMEHLPIHLAHEAKIAGPVQYRWNYFVERNLRDLKSYVRNRSRPEGSICEGYLVEECLTFCSRYFHDVETRFNRAGRNEDNGNMAVQPNLSIFQSTVRSLGKPKIRRVSSDEYKQARLYILQNCVEVIPYLQEHRQLVANEGVHKKEFFHWFDKKISDMHKANPEVVSDELLALAHGPDRHVKCFSGAIINGFRFHTRDREAQRKTQNSGIKVAGEIINDGTSSTRSGIVDFYGVLTRIMQLQYAGRYPIFLFKCDWWDVFNEGVGYVKDNYGYISLNFAKMLKTDEPFVLATQATQVFYVKDNLRIGWNIVVDSPPRDYYNMPVETCKNELLLDDEEPMKEDCFVDFERENSV